MRVYIIRHGQSEANQKKLLTGWTDVRLTEEGINDAKKAGRLLKDISFDKIYSSDLVRAMETAGIALPGCQFQTSPALREINVGSLQGTPLAARTPEQKKKCNREGYKDYNGETQEEFYGRVALFQKELESQDCENIAVFSHAGWSRAFLDTVLGTRLSRQNICCNNCSVAIYEYVNGIWRLYSWINP